MYGGGDCRNKFTHEIVAFLFSELNHFLHEFYSLLCIFWGTRLKYMTIGFQENKKEEPYPLIPPRDMVVAAVLSYIVNWIIVQTSFCKML